jgi:protein-S-isoprenylcysteine O-methyltransferase Ste14
LMLFWWAIKTNRENRLSAAFSSDLPSQLVDRGPYRFIRHPFYTSYLLTWVAGIPASGQAWLLVTVAVMFTIYFKAARMEEEKFRRSDLSENYRRYASRTGMFFPRLIG